MNDIFKTTFEKVAMGSIALKGLKGVATNVMKKAPTGAKVQSTVQKVVTPMDAKKTLVKSRLQKKYIELRRKGYSAAQLATKAKK